MTAPATIDVSAPTPTAAPPVLLVNAFTPSACASAAHPGRRGAVHHRVRGVTGERTLIPAAPTAGSRKALR